MPHRRWNQIGKATQIGREGYLYWIQILPEAKAITDDETVAAGV